MSIPEFIGRHLTLNKPQEFADICAFCGSKIAAGFSLHKVVSSKFNDWQYIKHNSRCICQFCQACLSSTGFNGKSLRSYSTLTTLSGIRILEKAQIAPVILNPPDPPFVVMVTFTHKKHIFLHARVTTSLDTIYVATDRADITIEPSEFRRVHIACSILCKSGFSKSEILSGRYRKWRCIDKLGAMFFRLEHTIRQYRGSFYLDFVLHTVTKEKNNDQN